MALYRIKDKQPDVHPSAFVAESADVIGQVILKEQTSVWSHVTLRGDNEPITIGARSNVQESSVLHTDIGYPLTIGEDVTVGHQAMLHGCTIGDGSLIGIQAVVLNGARIGKNCLVAAGALVTEGKVFEDGMLIMGSPAKAVRPLNEADILRMKLGTGLYVQKSAEYKTDMVRIDAPGKTPHE
ncbi:gamma carbonic anhydrase family protein [Aquabacterium fontiphilum]|uniref:gamma carbonic anhydrase family protein n=1 Tax=Aquabacterium fontiphilum TaxID=450365 RepID=UPI001376B08E|nr:gamma carbonic anhydrase family protein [Aquabacterium fontiphilum]NBD19971.1 gamma carbonic anhydrase family protein [Aquabacterium fontiphilum]